jgi:hypothetical protein
VHPRIWIRPSKRVSDRGRRRLRTMFCRIPSLHSATLPNRCDGPDRRADATQSLVIGRRKCVRNVELTQENVPRRRTFKRLLAVGPLEQRHQTAQGWPIHRSRVGPVSSGLGRLSPLRLEIIGSPHFASMNFRIDTWSYIYPSVATWGERRYEAIDGTRDLSSKKSTCWMKPESHYQYPPASPNLSEDTSADSSTLIDAGGRHWWNGAGLVAPTVPFPG